MRDEKLEYFVVHEREWAIDIADFDIEIIEK